LHLRRPGLALGLVSAIALTLPLAAQQQGERVDYDAIYKIKEEGFQRSRVMEVMSYLTDVHGPRLTGSPNTKAATAWTVKQLTEWGLANVHTEPFPFGRGWANERMVAHVVSPQPYPILAYPQAWTPGTNGPVTGDAVMVTLETPEDLAKYKGQLKGKFVLTQPEREVLALFEPPGRRFSDQDLADMAGQVIAPRGGGRGARGGRQGGGGRGGGQNFAQQRTAFLVAEGVAATLQPGTGTGGTVFVGGGGSRDPKGPPTVPQVTVAVEHYNRIVRTLAKNIPVRIEMDIVNKFYDEDLNAYNILGEIPGTDKADEIVMLGGHFDSWHTGTGATDNAAGSAVMMEAVRILKTAGLKMRRTVRLALWPGEEQGLIGSREYVTAHFGDRATMQLKPEHAKFSAYYNVDNGTGAIRGVYLQGNEAVAPLFKVWMEPFHNIGMTTLTIRNTGGTDHQSFDAVGLPGFQFIQDPVEYNSRTHHSNMDVYDRIQASDMMKNAVIVASFVYHTANREQLLPRKPLPRPAGRGRGTGQ
jgi:hypothetical protein